MDSVAGFTDQTLRLLSTAERDQGALLARIEGLQGILLGIEVHLEHDDVSELGPLGERIQHLVLRLAGGTPRGGDVDQDRLVGALRGLEGRVVVLSLLQRCGSVLHRERRQAVQLVK